MQRNSTSFDGLLKNFTTNKDDHQESKSETRDDHQETMSEHKSEEKTEIVTVSAQISKSKQLTQSPEQIIISLLERLALHPELNEQKVNLPNDWEAIKFPTHDQITLADEIKYPEGIKINPNTVKMEHLVNCIRQPLYNYFKQFVDKWQFTLPLPQPIQLCANLLLNKPNLFNAKDCDFIETIRNFQSKLMVDMVLWIEKNKMNPHASLNIPQQLLDAGFNVELWRNFHVDFGGNMTRLALSPDYDKTMSACVAWKQLAKLDHKSLASQNPDIFADADPEFLKRGDEMYFLKFQGSLILIALNNNMVGFVKLLLERGASLTKNEIFRAIPYMSIEMFSLLANVNQTIATKFETPFSSDSISKLVDIIININRTDLLDKLFEIMNGPELIDLLHKNRDHFNKLMEHIMLEDDPKVLSIFLKNNLNPNYFFETSINTREQKSLLTLPMTRKNMENTASRSNMHKKIKLLLKAHANPSLPLIDEGSYWEGSVKRNALEHFRRYCGEVQLRNFSWFGLTRATLTPEGKEYFEIKKELKDAMKMKR